MASFSLLPPFPINRTVPFVVRSSKLWHHTNPLHPQCDTQKNDPETIQQKVMRVKIYPLRKGALYKAKATRRYDTSETKCFIYLERVAEAGCVEDDLSTSLHCEIFFD